MGREGTSEKGCPPSLGWVVYSSGGEVGRVFKAEVTSRPSVSKALPFVTSQQVGGCEMERACFRSPQNDHQW